MSDQASSHDVIIGSRSVSACISAAGAELRWLRDSAGRDLLWDGDPAVWKGRAPILFPVVGGVAGGTIQVDGARYPMARHGVARTHDFAMVEQAPDAVTFRLEADATTRASYPFDFRLDIRFALAGSVLSIEADLHNPGSAPLPASFGFHPALRWPLPGGGARAGHRILFECDEPAPIRRVGADGLLRAQPEPSPVVGRELQLADALFEDDALIFDRLASRRLTYGAPGQRQLEISFPDMPMLGIWTRPGAGFLCIEPWQGIADPVDFSGDFRDKPGVVEVAPGAGRRFAIRIDCEGGSLARG